MSIAALELTLASGRSIHCQHLLQTSSIGNQLVGLKRLSEVESIRAAAERYSQLWVPRRSVHPLLRNLSVLGRYPILVACCADFISTDPVGSDEGDSSELLVGWLQLAYGRVDDEVIKLLERLDWDNLASDFSW